MNIIILDDIPFEIDINLLLECLHIKKDSKAAQEVCDLASYAQTLAKPKVVYKQSYIESSGDDFVVDGVILRSYVLRVNLTNAKRVFPFLATCGMELEKWSNTIDKLLYCFWIDTIKSVALDTAFSAFTKHLEENFNPGATSIMTPGTLNDWPIQEQRNIFTILGDSSKAIGVKLTESLMMIPVKSISGLRFPSEENFFNCRLCSRENCLGRMVPYDEHLYEKKYHSQKSKAK
ncbi:vitamin B12 dependent methionine synthase [candidate division WOR-3 bacterium]|nr:vitamin B12 dependent methionine synthase [candidate division WOR-3 bacterium]